MSTAHFQNWAGNIMDIGPIYPFVGSEFLWFLVVFVVWIVWHVVQSRMETRTYEEEIERYGSPATLRDVIKHEDPRHP